MEVKITSRKEKISEINKRPYITSSKDLDEGGGGGGERVKNMVSFADVQCCIMVGEKKSKIMLT